MLNKLGKIIEKKPWVVIAVVLLITAGFSIFIPSLEFKTEFRDFMPEDQLVEANSRVFDYFGMNKQITLLLVEKQQSEHTITPQAIREQYFIQKEIERMPYVNTSISIATFIDAVCQVEFGKTLENCTDEQLLIALQDMLIELESREVQILDTDDPNEPFDFSRYPKISKGKGVDSADVRNFYILKDDENLTFSVEVYDLSDLQSTLKPSFQRINLMEWYIDFENLIIPDERLDIKYRIAAHIEPTHPLWEIGKGFFANLREFLLNLRNRELFNSYKKEVYLWIKPPEQTMYFPMPLETGNITFDINQNRINIIVSQNELRNFGITPRFGSFELPAKLTNFSAGVRYYQTPIFKRAGGRVILNTSFLFSRFEKLRSRPILGTIATRMLQKFSGISWEDFDNLFELMEQTALLPDTIALHDFESNWIQSEKAPDNGVTDTVFFMYPALFDDLQVSALSFLSKDYEITRAPRESLIILQLDFGENYEEIVQINNEIVQRIKELDEQSNFISIEVTGEGIISSQIDKVTSEANQIIGPSIFIIIILILLINFRKLSYVALPMLALGISTIWLFGTMSLLGIAFNVIAVALVPLIMGLGVDYSVHLFHNYRAELEKNRTPAQAMKRSVKDIGTAMFLAMITTVIAFMSFLTASVPPIRDFGILLGLGVTYTFLTAITLLASTRYILDRRKKVVIKQKKSMFSVRNIMGKTSQLVLCHQKKILIVLVLISVIMAIGAIQIERGFDMNQFIPEDNPALQLFKTIAKDFPYSSQDQEYILIEGNVASVEVLKGIAKIHDNLEDDIFVSRNIDDSTKTTSIYTVIQNAVKNNRSLIKTYNIDETTGIPKADKDVNELYEYLYTGKDFGEIPQEKFDISQFGGIEAKSVLYRKNSRYESTLIRIYVDPAFLGKGGNIQDELEVLKRELNDDIEIYGEVTALATGNLIIQLTIINSLTTSQIISTAICLVLAAFVIIVVYRNPTLGIITMIPVAISIVWILGMMYYLGYILNVMTVTVTSITIGIGVDYAIHATQRFRLVADKTGDITKAVCETISHTGGALLIAALTTALGFGILVFAPIPPQQQFGVIIAITIVFAFLTSVLLLPLMLVRWAKWRKKHKGYIISPGRPKDEIDSD